MIERKNQLPVENQQKSITKDQEISEKTLNKAKKILDNPKHKKLLTYILKYLYINLPINEFQQEHPFPFVDHLYMLNYAVTSIMVNWKIANKKEDAYVSDPDLRCQLMELIYKSDEFNSFKPKQISADVIRYLARLKQTFLKMMDDIYDLHTSMSLEYLVKIHDGSQGDSRDHMSKTCFDRAKLINELLLFDLEVNDQDMEPLHQNVVISYLNNFYGPGSLKQYLPQDLQTSEEKILASLIDLYEKIVEKSLAEEKSLAQSSVRFSFSQSKNVEIQNVHDLLSSMRNIIKSYEEIYKEQPYYMTNILWRINGLIPPQVQPTKSLVVSR